MFSIYTHLITFLNLINSGFYSEPTQINYLSWLTVNDKIFKKYLIIVSNYHLLLKGKMLNN
jgi:hypothetical protein